MVTRRSARGAGVLALVTAVLLLASLLTFAGGPPTTYGGNVLDWFADNALSVHLSTALWLLAVISLVTFAIAFHEAMWATVLDRFWATTFFVQGAAAFAAVAAVAGAVGWALAQQASADAISGELAATVWAIDRALLRFATWGLVVPIVVVAFTIYRHSILGQFTAVVGGLVAVGLIVPFTWYPALFAASVWLALSGVTLLLPLRHRARHPEFAPPSTAG